MNIEEAAAFLAERPLAPRVNIESPFPVAPQARKFGRGLDPHIQRWVRRIREGTASMTLSHYRDDANPRGQVYYRQDDLTRWARQLFPRQEALRV